MKRLARAGCVSHMRARVTPAEAEDDSEEDAEVAHDNAPVDSSFDLTYEPKEKKKRKKRLSQARWVRCVRLMHEPTEKDKHAFTSTTKLPKETSTEVQNDSDTDDNDDALAELDVDDPMIQSIVDPRNWNEEEVVERIPPQWQPQMHQTHFMFHYIDSCGSAGISTMVCLKGLQQCCAILNETGSHRSRIGPFLASTIGRTYRQTNRCMAYISTIAPPSSLCGQGHSNVFHNFSLSVPNLRELQETCRGRKTLLASHQCPARDS